MWTVDPQDIQSCYTINTLPMTFLLQRNSKSESFCDSYVQTNNAISRVYLLYW